MTGEGARPRPLVAGNWKMNGRRSAIAEAKAVADALAARETPPRADILVCPPATLVMVMAEILKDAPLAIGAQDCHWVESGAHTGDLSAEILADAGASAIIVGHSERRAYHDETDLLVKSKQQAVHRAGLTAIVCIGETKGQRLAGQTIDVVVRQLERSLCDATTPENTVVAYEPVWAIGTGLTPTNADVADVHAAIRDRLVARFGEAGHAIRILYGGSVKPQNAKELMAVANVDGALVGGASLKAADFLGIIAAYE
ncbi:MAG: triose-phosphate isomerase [Hyphomicrobium sp. 32-62-53]|nr:MAG: triose-phosphate isomerase [Hyphomicrobium sp. 12-62-95]OYX98692.1 MAG: triose-phosphate isomerase [Hyphomicrobium sp. 32-62-53]